MFSVKLVEGEHFGAEPGESILQAALRAGTNLNYSCRTGRCSACKCKLVSGETTAQHPELGLTDQEKADGWILSCVRTVDSDVTVEAQTLGAIILPTAKTVPCRVSEIIRLAPDVVQVLLRVPPSARFDFLAGQYVDVIGPGGERRSYSLANATAEDHVLELQVRFVEGGVMSQYWFHQAKANDLLRLHGPLGTFFLRDAANADVYFLATGTGIAPLKAMLSSMMSLPEDQQPRSVTVLWGGRALQDHYFDVSALPGKHVYIPVLSRPDADWGGAKGYVQDVLLDLNPDLENAVVYACGSDAMIHSAQARLVDAGLSPKRFHSDAFVCSGTI
ncbi:CDP-6-deoxy-L-threo-D-glycero-4-hexulose-3-dehydrase reductase [Pandoraea communis]|uniref:CDP-6-deoxy-L-threo-D-glycero-4-hexulose-3-dehydrase reductase n=1 Tax=Pandoraea communis TaxID=2508297 RepID=A0A5E4T7F6_9BURK|nr:2Fe-2S iron-sulfur cluster-binding protein [Pandoraea communis]VVD83152.1 CDP-6-deoxy-L-threo-D-glycero-4-hexulose-3-dehydrase reductase [Pandoraea communis]